MTKAKIIAAIRTRGERDLTISGDAWRLLARLCSYRFVDPKATMDKAFPLPWSQVAVWCGLKDDKSCSRKTAELVDAGYLIRDELRGCPGVMHYFLTGHSCPSKGATSCPESGATVTPSRGATSSGAKGAHHISNSFQEERLEERGRGIKSSLRSKETSGAALAAPPAAQMETNPETTGDDQRKALSALRESLAKPSKNSR